MSVILLVLRFHNSASEVYSIKHVTILFRFWELFDFQMSVSSLYLE